MSQSSANESETTQQEEKVSDQKQQDAVINEMVITKPDDFHLHLRDGASLPLLVPHTTFQYSRAIVMPNLVPPVRNIKDATAYRERVMSHVPKGTNFTPLMTLYLTDNTTSEDIIDAHKSGIIFGVKLYPKGATTNSDSGVTDISKLGKVFSTMADCNIPLLIHGEVTDKQSDVFDRESIFLDKILPNIIKMEPKLKIVLEHISTRKAVETIENLRNKQGRKNIGATITAHHLLSNRNEIFNGGINPHMFCLPIIKTEDDRLALVDAAMSGKNYYFGGTDSAPHEKCNKEKCCGKAGIYTGYNSLALYATVFDENGCLDKFENFVSKFGAEFYGLKLNKEKIKLIREKNVIPQYFDYNVIKNGKLIPYKAGQTVEWLVKQC